MIDMVKVDIQYLGHYWKSLGRPTLIFPIRQNLLGSTTTVMFAWFYCFVTNSHVNKDSNTHEPVPDDLRAYKARLVLNDVMRKY